MNTDKMVRVLDLIAAILLGSGLTFFGLALWDASLFLSKLGFAIIALSAVAVMVGRYYFKSKK
jgi:hypothetical protein